MKRALVVLGVAGIIAAAFAFSSQPKHPAQALDMAFIQAMKNNDAAAVGALYAPNAVFFPPAGAMANRGSAEIQAGFNALMDTLVIRDLKVVDSSYRTEGDLSVGWGTFRMYVVAKAGGDPFWMEGRFNCVATKVDGKWMYISDHVSMPLPEE